MNIPRKIGLAGLITKVLSITLLHAFMSVAVSTVGPLTVWSNEEEEMRRALWQRQERARKGTEEEKTLRI